MTSSPVSILSHYVDYTEFSELSNALTDLIDEIYHNLQEMSLDDLENDKFLQLRPNGLPNGWGYWYEKLSENVFGNGYPSELWLPRIEDIFADKFAFSYESTQELFVLVQAAIYRLSKEEGVI